MIGRRGTLAAFLLLVGLAGAVPNPGSAPTHRPALHNARFPPLDDDTREPAILDEVDDPDERVP